MARAPFKLTPFEPPEREIHKACAAALDSLLLPPAMWACYPAGVAQLSPQQMARYSELGLKRGWPDIMVSYHAFWGIEIKRVGGRLSKTRIGRTRKGSPKILTGQEEVFPQLIESGGFAAIAIVHSVEEMLDQLARWHIPLRPHHLVGMKKPGGDTAGPVGYVTYA
jgi:hypothetical protein